MKVEQNTALISKSERKWTRFGSERKSQTSVPSQKRLTIALAGNPNAGKTTLFNALTGMKQKVANYPGVTVERKEGFWRLGADRNAARLIDLPGLYSLDATSIDEQIARDVLTGNIENLPKPDIIVAVVDATNLERNLYLVTQLLDYKIPVVVALTMIDVAEKQSLEIDTEKLSFLLQVPVVEVKAAQRKGIEKLAETVLQTTGTEPKKNSYSFSALNSENESDNAFDHFSSPDDSRINKQIFARYNFISEIYQESVKPKHSEEKQRFGKNRPRSDA